MSRTETLPGGFTIGSQLIIIGSTHSLPDSLSIDLGRGPTDVIFRLTVEFGYTISCRLFYSTRHALGRRIYPNLTEFFSSVLDRPFIIEIFCNWFGLAVSINQRIQSFPCRLPMTMRITHLTVGGSAAVKEIRLYPAAVEGQSNAPFHPESLPDGHSEEVAPYRSKPEPSSSTKISERHETKTHRMIFKLPKISCVPKIVEILRLRKVLKMIQLPRMCPMPEFFSIFRMFSTPKMTKKPHEPLIFPLPKTSYVSETSSLNPFLLQIVK